MLLHAGRQRMHGGNQVEGGGPETTFGTSASHDARLFLLYYTGCRSPPRHPTRQSSSSHTSHGYVTNTSGDCMPNWPMLSSRKRGSIMRNRRATYCASIAHVILLLRYRSTAHPLDFVAQFLEPAFEPIAMVALDLNTVALDCSTGATELFERLCKLAHLCRITGYAG